MTTTEIKTAADYAAQQIINLEVKAAHENMMFMAANAGDEKYNAAKAEFEAIAAKYAAAAGHKHYLMIGR